MSSTDVQAGAGPARTDPGGARGCVVVRYAEIGLKGRNRRLFENRLLANLRRALSGGPEAAVERAWGRMLVFPEGDPAAVASRLAEVFGVASVSPGVALPKDLDAIEARAIPLVAEALERFPGDGAVPFRVEATRADKSFPTRSVELNRRLGATLLQAFPRLKVDLARPALTVGLDLREEAAYLFGARMPGPGGLPVGVSGRVLALVSGGIDSPVAAWLAMKRGCEALFVTFHSHPFVGEATKEKVIDLVRRLSRFQGRSLLFVAPFAEIQTELRRHAPEPYRTLLYRRLMHRIAARIARRKRCAALVTGDSIGQVASQTLANLHCAEEAVDLPVFRPLLTYDKHETVALAERIGTFPISIRPGEDCCTVFQPEHPVIRGSVAICRGIEAKIETERLVEEASRGCEVWTITPSRTERRTLAGALPPSPGGAAAENLAPAPSAAPPAAPLRDEG